MHNPVTYVVYDGDKPVTREQLLFDYLGTSQYENVSSGGSSFYNEVNEIGFDNLSHSEFFMLGEFHTEERAREASVTFYDNPAVMSVSFLEFQDALRRFLNERPE